MCDPWLEGQLRLADRQGLLSGKDLSRPALLGLQILMMLDARSRNDDFYQSLRANLVAAHPERIREVFPEWYQDDAAFEGAIKDDGSVDPDLVDESKLQWTVPGSREESDEIERWIAEHMSGTVSAAGLQVDEEGWH